MGCASSRDDQRRDAQNDDFNVVPFNFTVADAASPDGFAPMDKLAIKMCGDGKDFKDGVGEIADAKMAADKAKELAVKIQKALVDEHKKLSGMDLDKGKNNDVACKYSPKEACDDVEAVLIMLSEKSGIEECKWTPAAKGDGMTMEPDMMMMMEPDMMMEADMMAEGGDPVVMGEDMAKAAGMEFFNKEEFGESGGPELLPKLLLEALALHPYVGDLVRAQVCSWELGGTAGEEWKEISTLLGAFVEAGEKEEVDVYGAAWLGPQDIEDFEDVNKNKETKALIFPGVIFGFSSAEDAMTKLKAQENKKQKLEKYTFHVKASAMKGCGGKIHAIHRLFAKIASADAKDGVTGVELTLFADYATKSMAEFAEKCAAAKAVGDAVKDKIDDKMENMEKKEEMMMEPEMMEPMGE